MDLVGNFLSQKNIDSEITFEKYIMLNTKLNNEKQYSVKDACYFNANNDNLKWHYDENKILEIHLNNMLFEQDLVFDNVKKLSLIINDNVKFDKLFINNCNELYLQFNGRVEVIDKISINDCKFKQISINNHIDGNIEFQKCEFNDFNLYGFPNATIKGAFTFDFCEIKEKANFMNFEFKNKVSFKMSKFKDNTYFNNSVFKDYADFHECEFEKTASFYGVTFEKAPNFSACYFKEPKAINLINIDIDKLDFKSVEQYIKDNYQDESYKNKIKNISSLKKDKIDNKHQLRYAKNLKDSFRTIKDILITQNSILEAQEWHKLELYAKEKELEIKLGNNKDGNLQKEYENQIYNPKDYEKVDYSRIAPLIICLLKAVGHLFINILIFFELILVVPFFAVMFYCVYIGLFIYKILVFILKSFYPLSMNKFKIFWKIKLNRIIRKLVVFGRKILDFTLWFDCILLQVYRNTSNHHTNFLKILNFTILMISSYAIFGLLFLKNMDFILSFGPMTIATTNYIVLLMLLIIFIDLTRQLYQHGAILLFLICGLFIISIASFLSPTYIPAFYFLTYFASVLISYLLFICKIKLFIFISRLFAYTCLIGVVILKPQLINPFVGIFSSDKLYESKFEKRLNDLNTSAIINLAKLSQKDFNFTKEYINISFTELNSAKALIIANKEKLKEILSKVYNDKYVSDYKKVLNGLENNTSNVKNIIEEIDNKNNNNVVSTQLNRFLKLNFTQEVDFLHGIKRIFSIDKQLSPEQLALFDQKDSQDKLKNILSLLNFKVSFEEILKIIKQDENMQGVIKSTSILYSIILLLCIFSLQKTARKNSIVPS